MSDRTKIETNRLADRSDFAGWVSEISSVLDRRRAAATSLGRRDGLNKAEATPRVPHLVDPSPS